MLVVIAIIGIILTFATLTLGGDRRAEELSRESRQFAELLRIGSEQAVLRGEEWAVQVSDEDYRFLVYTESGWQPVENDELLRERDLAEDTVLDVELEGRDLVLDTGEEKDGALKPTFLLLSSGEISPFIATFSARATNTRYQVKGDLDGSIDWETLPGW